MKYFFFTFRQKAYWVNAKFPFLHTCKKLEYYDRFPWGYSFLRRAIIYLLKNDPVIRHLVCTLVLIDAGKSITYHPDDTITLHAFKATRK